MKILGIHFFALFLVAAHDLFLKAMIRFDDSTTRNVRLKTPRSGAFRDIFEAVNKQCAKNMSLNEYVATETLYLIHGAVGFNTHNEDKPTKYSYLSIYLSILSIYLSIYLSVCVCVCVCVCVVKKIDNIPSQLLPICQWSHGNLCT